MAIGQKYLEMLDALEAIAEDLDDWPRRFIMGDQTNPDKKKRTKRMRDNEFLSRPRKDKIEELYAKHVLNEPYKKKTRLKIGQLAAKLDKERGYIVHIDGNEVGEGISRKEATAVIPWLHESLSDILNLPGEATEAYMHGTPEVKEEPPKKKKTSPKKDQKETTAVDPECGF